MPTGDCFPLFEIFLNHVLISRNGIYIENMILFLLFNIKESFHEHPELKKAHEEALL